MIERWIDPILEFSYVQLGANFRDGKRAPPSSSLLNLFWPVTKRRA